MATADSAAHAWSARRRRDASTDCVAAAVCAAMAAAASLASASRAARSTCAARFPAGELRQRCSAGRRHVSARRSLHDAAHRRRQRRCSERDASGLLVAVAEAEAVVAVAVMAVVVLAVVTLLDGAHSPHSSEFWNGSVSLRGHRRQRRSASTSDARRAKSIDCAHCRARSPEDAAATDRCRSDRRRA